MEKNVFQEFVSEEVELQNQIFELKQTNLSFKEFEDAKHQIRLKIESLRKRIDSLEFFLRSQNAEEDVIDKFARNHESTLQGFDQNYLKKAYLSSLVQLLRQATLEYKDNQIKRTIQERENLLEINEATMIRQRKLKTKQELLNTSNKLTDVLQRTSNRMLTETHKSSAILEELASSSLDIDKTLQGHKDLATSIHLGRRFLNKLKQRDFTDKLLLVFALLFFFSVILYILKSRLNL